MTVTTDSERIAALVTAHGIEELAQAIYEWVEDDLKATTQEKILDAIRSYGDIAP